jgi:C-terminal processing protease CtpA/Prc
MYVDLTRISDGELTSALPQLEEARGIVFDVRGYPKVSPDSIGYLIEETVSSPLMAIPNVISPDQQDTVYDFTSWDVEPRTPYLTGTIVFLIDERAISYAETYMSIIAYYDLAVIVGTPTAGTNGNVNPFTIPGGYSFNWTGMRVVNQDGSQFHGIGILPDIYVERTGQGFAEGRDEQLEMAIEIINQEN